MPELAPNLGFPIPPGGDSSLSSLALRAALLALDNAVKTSDTGWIDHSSLLRNGWTGTVLVRRIGADVHLKLVALNGDASTATSVLLLPVGFRAHATAAERGLLHQLVGASPATRRWWATDNNFQVASGQGAGDLYGTCNWLTSDAWPTT